MTTAFLSRVLGEDGYYCLFASRRSDDRKVQKFYTDLHALYDDALNYDDQDYDVYFALATFETDEGRTKANAKQLRSFFLDLDCGEGKEFPTKEAALEALQNFCMRLGLPKPLLVDSGRGIHVYWTLKEQVSRDTWLPVAERLKELCTQHNFGADPAVTSDVARILRIPTTHNYKEDPALPVKMLVEAANNTLTFDEFRAIVGETALKKPSVHIPAQLSAVGEKLLSNKTSYFKRILTRPDSCAQLIHAISNQASIDEPLWRATLSIAAHCEDREKAVHVVSKDHPEYDYDVTEEKARRIKGPYLCARFDEYNPGLCQDCPHFGKISSPITLGNELKIAETDEERTVEVKRGITTEGGYSEEGLVVIPKPPHPYVRGAAGGVYRRTVDEDGGVDEILVYHHDLYVTRRVWDVELGYLILLKLHLPQDGVREFTITQQAASSPEEIRKELAKNGVACSTPNQWKALGVYVMDYINELQARTGADLAHRQFGWTEDFGSFVLGDREYFPDRVGYNPPTPATVNLIADLKPRGDLDEWKEMMQFFNHKGMELHQMIVCAGFGSPLMAFSAVNALMTHLDGPTGFGKTTTQHAMLGIYGDPATLILSDQDTLNSKLARFELMKNLPIAIDEITNHTPREASTLVYTMSQGRQKNRMSSGSNSERLRGDPWALRVISSGNASIMGKIESEKANADAERQRAFEVNISDYIYAHSKTDADAFQSRLKEVYGVAADPYLKWLVANVEEARAAFLDMQTRLDAATGLTSKNRFISAGYAADLVGGRIAHALGLIQFDMKALFKFTVELIKSRIATDEANVKSPTDYLVDYLAEHYNDILRIKAGQDLRSKDDIADEFVVPDSTPRGQYIARYETDMHKLYILPKPFKKWCIAQQLNPKTLIDQLSEDYEGQYKKVRLTKGTKMDLPPVEVYIFTFNLDRIVDAEGSH